MKADCKPEEYLIKTLEKEGENKIRIGDNGL